MSVGAENQPVERRSSNQGVDVIICGANFNFPQQRNKVLKTWTAIGLIFLVRLNSKRLAEVLLMDSFDNSVCMYSVVTRHDKGAFTVKSLKG